MTDDRTPSASSATAPDGFPPSPAAMTPRCCADAPSTRC